MNLVKPLVLIIVGYFVIAGLWDWATTPAPMAGDNIVVTDQARGCRIINPVSGEWSDCRTVEVGTVGKVESHPDGLGHNLDGRVRIRLASGGILWLLPGDLKILK